MRKRKARLLMGALGLLFAVLCLPRTALAYDAIPSLDGMCSLTIESRYPGVTYELYRVCTVDEWANFTPTKAFEPLSDAISLEVADRKWARLTSTLAAYLIDWEADGKAPAPSASAVSGRDGKAVFTELPTGLYLVTGRALEVEPGKRYTPASFMICLPNWEVPDASGAAGGGEWVYDVTVVNKGEEDEDRETVTLGVLKLWEGGGSIARPTEVTVQLLRTDRETDQTIVWDTVTLNTRRGGSNTWTELDNDYLWSVREVDVPSEYEAVYTREGATIIITNRYDPDIPKNDSDPDPPDGPHNPGNPGNPGNPDNPGNPGSPGSPGNPGNPDGPGSPAGIPDDPPNIPSEEIDDSDTPLSNLPDLEDDPSEDEPEEEDLDDPDVPLEKLPQTGVLWWPVPFLAMGGLFLFILGWALNRRDYEE